MTHMIDFYNYQATAFAEANAGRKKPMLPKDFVDTNPTKISWSRGLYADVGQGKQYKFNADRVFTSMYRPFSKQAAYFDRAFNDMVYKMDALFPFDGAENLVFPVTGRGSTKEFSTLMTNVLPDLELISKGQCFPLYYYEPVKNGAKRGLFNATDEVVANGFVRKDAITDETLGSYRRHYSDSSITKVDIFHYVYGLLHSPEYRERFEADLKKTLPRIPFAEDFHAFKTAGYELADLHVNYENGPKHPLAIRNTHPDPSNAAAYRVEKMKYAGRRPNLDKSTIIYNQFITIHDIPEEAYEYVVNGKAALDWIMERYAITTDKASGIVNDPNEYSDNPQYILDLIQQVTYLSVETVRIVNSLPALNEHVPVGEGSAE